MGKISDAIAAAKAGDINPLLDCAKNLPSNGVPTSDFDPDGAPPSDESGESFNTITAAKIRGDITAEQYNAVLKVAETAREASQPGSTITG